MGQAPPLKSAFRSLVESFGIDPADLAKLSELDQIALEWQLQWRTTARASQLPPPGDWTTWGAVAGRGWGKLLSHDTQLPTPSGWTTMGDVRVGDELFDEAGRPCCVVGKYSPPVNQAYELEFSDGSTIVADADHQWVTWTHRDRKALLRSRFEDHSRFPANWPNWRVRTQSQWQREPVVGDIGPQIRTTQEIVKTLTYNARGDTNHCVPNCAPLELPEKTLPIPPYTLGCWLGDGSKRGSTMTCHEDDQPFTRASIEAEGFVTSNRKHPQNFGILGLEPLLRQTGLRLNKHVPDAYLRASPEQRLALLRGLMDTDGNIENGNSVAFVNTNKRLVDAVVELVHSLGMKTRVWSGVGACNGKQGLPFWRVQFTPSTINPFSLPRKAERLKQGGAQCLRNCHRMIVAVRPVPAPPMSCITVDSPNSMYLAGRGMIPTHNTLVGGHWIMEECWNRPGIIGHVIAPTFSDVQNTCFEGPSGIIAKTPPELISEYNKSDLIIRLPNSSMIRGFSAEKPRSLRGPQCHVLWADELAAWQYAQETWDMAMFGLRLGDHTKALFTTTPRPIPLVRALMADPKTVITRGSTYENRANLSSNFMDELITKFEGTTLGRQELHAELIDPEESGIIKRSWIKLWPHDRRLPRFEFIVVSLDTAFTEAARDKKTGDRDPTACTVWGLFRHEGKDGIMLLDCWQDMLGFPDLLKRVPKEMQQTYGDQEDAVLKPLFGKPLLQMGEGRKPDLLIIEDKGSGISLRQMLERESIHAYAYNPGNARKVDRLHAVSHLFANGVVWMVESKSRPGQPVSWADQEFMESTGLVSQLCSFTGEGSTKHDDFVDSTTQALRLIVDRNMVSIAVPREPDKPLVYTPPPRNPYG